MAAHRAPIISAAARNNVPAVYSLSVLARDGGLLSYGADLVDNWRRAASYVDRILRGAKPADLPVQLPTKFHMAVNLKAAKALGLAVPPSIMLRRRGDRMIRRREFIPLLGGAAAWPLAARAQQGDRVRRIGVLMPWDENDPVFAKPYLPAFTQGLAALGWTVGRNVQIDLRWAGGDANRIRALAQELVGLRPDIILTDGIASTAALQRETRIIPIVFASGVDPVASSIVARLDRPGGPVT
jgi:ABC-type uncharacterized transport system substrate-binding protein